MLTDKVQQQEYFAGYWLALQYRAQAIENLRSLRDQGNYRLGIEDGLDGNPPQVGTINDYRRSAASIEVPIGDVNRRNYLIGYTSARDFGYAERKRIFLEGLNGQQPSEFQQWLLQGLEDYNKGIPPRIDPNGGPDTGIIVRVAAPVVVAPPPALPSPGPGPGPTPAPPLPPVIIQPPAPYLRAKVFEVCAFAFFGLGSPMYFDRAYRLSRSLDARGNELLTALVSSWAKFEIIGDGIERNREGFGIGGQTGRIARAIVKNGINPDPRALGLNAFYGAQTSTGILLLNYNELAVLGLTVNDRIIN